MIEKLRQLSKALIHQLIFGVFHIIEDFYIGNSSSIDLSCVAAKFVTSVCDCVLEFDTKVRRKHAKWNGHILCLVKCLKTTRFREKPNVVPSMFWNFCSINETPGSIYAVRVLSNYLQSFWVKVLHILGRQNSISSKNSWGSTTYTMSQGQF